MRPVVLSALRSCLRARAFGAALSGCAFAADAWSTELSLADLKSLSFDDLMAVQVTSVSRRAEGLQDALASIYVITAEDIRRSGATNGSRRIGQDRSGDFHRVRSG